MPILNFNAAEVEPSEAFELIPAGWYLAQIDDSEMRDTRDGSSQYLQIRLAVLEGDHANRKLFDRFNIANANPVAREIAYKELSSVAHAVGVLHVADSQQLHGIPLRVKVRIRKDPNGTYDDQNEVTGYKSASEAVAGAASQPAWAAKQPATAAKAKAAPAAKAAADPEPAGDKPPWLR